MQPAACPTHIPRLRPNPCRARLGSRQLSVRPLLRWAMRTLCRDGGTGRRSGLKIRRGQPRGGSTPPPGTKRINGLENQRIFGCVFLCPNYDQCRENHVDVFGHLTLAALETQHNGGFGSRVLRRESIHTRDYWHRLQERLWTRWNGRIIEQFCCERYSLL